MTLETIASLPAMLAATHRAAREKRHRPDVAAFLMDAERRCLELRASLLDESWMPTPARVHVVRDPKPRLISIVPFPDRVVHHALCADLVPRLERSAIYDSWACRQGKGQHEAVRRAQRFALRYPWALKCDVSRYFASIPRAPLLASLPLEDVGFRRLMGRIVGESGLGLPIGALTSQHLANAWLGRLDHVVKDDWGVRGYLRYMDDFVLFGSRDDVRELQSMVVAVLSGLGLTLNPRVSQIVPTRDGVPFLGWRVLPNGVVARPATRARWANHVRQARSLGSEAAAARISAATAHIVTFNTFRVRTKILARTQEKGNDPKRCLGWLQPGEPWWLLEQHPRERAGGQPEQEHPGQPQEQPWSPSRQRSPPPRSHESPEAHGLRSAGACLGVAPVVVLRAGHLAGAESPPAGGGAKTWPSALP